jgi:hypothetical protein
VTGRARVRRRQGGAGFARVGRRFARILVVTALTAPVWGGVSLALARPGGGQSFSSGSSSSSGTSSGSSSSSSGTGSRVSGSSASTSGGSTYGVSGVARDPKEDERSTHFLMQFWGLVAATALLPGVLRIVSVGAPAGSRGLGWTTAPTPLDEAAAEAAFARARAVEGTWQTPAPLPAVYVDEGARRRRRDVPQAIATVGGHDPDFSWIVFEDFVSALYGAAHSRRGEGRLDDLAPYFSTEARDTYLAWPSAKVENVILGSLSDPAIFAIVEPGQPGMVEVQLLLVGNFTEIDRTGRARRYVSNERWFLRRGATAVSRAPEEARVLGCPNCGAPVGTHAGAPIERGHRCPFCRELVDTGEFDWRVTWISVRAREEIFPGEVGDADEEGTFLPTVVDPDAHERYEALVQRDPSQQWGDFVARVTLIFSEFQRAWSNDELPTMRPFLSDNLYTVQAQVLADARGAGIRNQVADAVLVSVELARVLGDRYFDAITVRVRATCVDFTTNRSGDLVAGNRTKRREYTEYWTFVRSAARQGAARADSLCPQCGATHQVNQAGQCRHCNVKITAGTFDWVLSRIEQDEVYRAL